MCILIFSDSQVKYTFKAMCWDKAMKDSLKSKIAYLNGDPISNTLLKKNMTNGIILQKDTEFNLQRSPKLCQRKSREDWLILNEVKMFP